MRIIKARDLKNEPNGTVFSDVTAPDFGHYDGDMEIHGLHILYGHDDMYNPVGYGFNGVLHMLEYVLCHNMQPDYIDDEDWKAVTDTAMHDYEDDNYVVIYDKHEIRLIIENLLEALEILN